MRTAGSNQTELTCGFKGPPSYENTASKPKKKKKTEHRDDQNAGKPTTENLVPLLVLSVRTQGNGELTSFVGKRRVCAASPKLVLVVSMLMLSS